jgi:hypothetical protein
MQREVDEIVRETLNSYDDGAIEEGDLSAFSLALEQFHHAVTDRKAEMNSMASDLARFRSRQQLVHHPEITLSLPLPRYWPALSASGLIFGSRRSEPRGLLCPDERTSRGLATHV